MMVQRKENRHSRAEREIHNNEMKKKKTTTGLTHNVKNAALSIQHEKEM